MKIPEAKVWNLEAAHNLSLHKWTLLKRKITLNWLLTQYGETIRTDFSSIIQFCSLSATTSVPITSLAYFNEAASGNESWSVH